MQYNASKRNFNSTTICTYDTFTNLASSQACVPARIQPNDFDFWDQPDKMWNPCTFKSILQGIFTDDELEYGVRSQDKMH